MDKVVAMITEKTGISESQAQTAVETVVGYLKDKMPEGMGKQVEGYLNGDGGDDEGGIAGKVGGMFGK